MTMTRIPFGSRPCRQHLLRALAVCGLLGVVSCHSTQQPPEITLPDGDVPGMQHFNYFIEGDAIHLRTTVLNLSGRYLDGINVDNLSGPSGLAMGSWDLEGGFMIPQDCGMPFFIRVELKDSEYRVRRIGTDGKEDEWGGDIYKSKLVKVEGPMPSGLHNMLLLIVYPKDRIVCEIYPGINECDEGNVVYSRIEELRKQRGIHD
jgi:hypothetical protein